jgi:hypothetical protein
LNLSPSLTNIIPWSSSRNSMSFTEYICDSSQIAIDYYIRY